MGLGVSTIEFSRDSNYSDDGYASTEIKVVRDHFIESDESRPRIHSMRKLSRYLVGWRPGRLLDCSVSRRFDYRTAFWFVLSVVVSMVFASRAMRQAFHSPYVLQDDWRDHVFWMARLADPDLFLGCHRRLLPIDRARRIHDAISSRRTASASTRSCWPDSSRWRLG